VSETFIALTARFGAADFRAADILGNLCLGAAVIVSLLLATIAVVSFAQADPIPAGPLFFDDDLEAFGDEPFELRAPAPAGKSRRRPRKPDTVLNVSRS
jgi:hypothetical protein